MYHFIGYCHVYLSWYTIFLGNESVELDVSYQSYLRAQEKKEKEFWCPLIECNKPGATDLCPDACRPGSKRCKFCLYTIKGTKLCVPKMLESFWHFIFYSDCDCEIQNSTPEVCNKDTGKCLCKAGFFGSRCDKLGDADEGNILLDLHCRVIEIYPSSILYII